MSWTETNNDKEFFSYLCLAILPLLLHDNQQITRFCAQIYKLLLLAKEQFMRDVLVSRIQGELVDLKTNGFELLLSVPHGDRTHARTHSRAHAHTHTWNHHTLTRSVAFLCVNSRRM
jgi:hypothetical protein